MTKRKIDWPRVVIIAYTAFVVLIVAPICTLVMIDSVMYLRTGHSWWIVTKLLGG